MPKLTVNEKTIDVPEGRRLVLAIESSGVNIGHRCGGFARCTTCRIKFLEGEPEMMTKAEYDKLIERNLFGQFRLSCQIVCDHDMNVQPQLTLESEGWSDTGPAPEERVTPAAERFFVDQLRSK